MLEELPTTKKSLKELEKEKIYKLKLIRWIKLRMLLIKVK